MEVLNILEKVEMEEVRSEGEAKNPH